MANRISGYGKGGIDVGTAQGSRAPARNEGSTGRATEGRPAAADTVQLTDSAARLRSLEARIANLAEVDAARVESVRRRIESGEYRIDAERIADRLIRFEREL